MSDVAEQVVDPIGSAVDELLERGKKRGYVTWEEMNEILPDDAIEPAQLEVIMLRLEEAKIETLDEVDAERYERRRKGRSKKRAGATDEQPQPDEAAAKVPASAAIPDEVGVKRIDDPVRIYLREIGRVSL